MPCEEWSRQKQIQRTQTPHPWALVPSGGHLLPTTSLGFLPSKKGSPPSSFCGIRWFVKRTVSCQCTAWDPGLVALVTLTTVSTPSVDKDLLPPKVGASQKLHLWYAPSAAPSNGCEYRYPETPDRYRRLSLHSHKYFRLESLLLGSVRWWKFHNLLLRTQLHYDLHLLLKQFSVENLRESVWKHSCQWWKWCSEERYEELPVELEFPYFFIVVVVVCRKPVENLSTGLKLFSFYSFLGLSKTCSNLSKTWGVYQQEQTMNRFSTSYRQVLGRLSKTCSKLI